jgi:hypothetical protein
LSEKNRQSSQELDRIFMLRKQRESETAKVALASLPYHRV